MDAHFPGETAEYRAAREKLKTLEIELRRSIEAVAKARRELPPGGLIPQDYRFEMAGPNGLAIPVTMSQLFANGKSTVVIYSYMFGPKREKPCNMCTPILDGFDGIEEHVRQRLNLFIVAESPPDRLQAYAKTRGWKRLQFLSAAGNSYNKDYWGLNEKGEDTTMLNVFSKKGGEIRHFWGTEMAHGPNDPGQDHRAMDPISPIFQMLDMTPEGRGDFYTKLAY